MRYHGEMDAHEGSQLRNRRLLAGLTQRELAERARIPQPNIAAYETGKRRPSPETASRLVQALTVPTLEGLTGAASEIARLAAKRHLSRVRVFGSVARGEETPDSDVDLLVTPAPDASIFDIAAFQADVSDLLGLPVDVVSDRGSGPTMERIIHEAVPL